jgi:signal transduction histidine kinase
MANFEPGKHMLMNKLKLSRILMTSTILLIAAFQVYWLTRLYREEDKGLRKSVDVAFKESMYQLKVERLRKDTSLFRHVNGNDVFLGDLASSIKLSFTATVTPDSIDNKPKGPQRLPVKITTQLKRNDTLKASRIFPSVRQMPDTAGLKGTRITRYVFSSSDSTGAMRQLPPEVLQHIDPSKIKSIIIRKGDSLPPPKTAFKGKTFQQISTQNGNAFIAVSNDGKDTIVKLGKNNRPRKEMSQMDGVIRDIFVSSRGLNDSIPVKSIDSAYTAALAKQKIHLRFHVVKDTTGKETDNEDSLIYASNPIQTTHVPVGFVKRVNYQAVFGNPSWFILQRISPQIILSFIIVALTLVSFVFIYRNLLAQQRLAAMKNEFISNITHELKTPIATVNVAIEALRNFGASQSPERTKEYLDISASELQRLSLLVDKVLKLSMFENKAIELRKEIFDMRELLHEVLATMKLQFDKRHAKVHVTAEGESFLLYADKLHITSVMYNLLDNALKYSKEQPEISISLTRKNDHVHLTVADNGIGIPAEYTDKVFDKFFRVPTGNVHNTKGYGLGLSYVAHVVDKHDGRISVQSEVNKGSIFIVTLNHCRQQDTLA